MVENNGVCRLNRVAISFPSKVISTSGLVAAILEFRITADVGRVKAKSSTVENVGVVIEIGSSSISHSKVIPTSVLTSFVGQCLRCHSRAKKSQKPLGYSLTHCVKIALSAIGTPELPVAHGL